MTMDSGQFVEIPWVDGQTVGSVLRATAARFPERDALVFPASDLRWSWRELDRRVDVVAASLLRLGHAPGSHVGIWSMNAPEWVVTQFAVGRIGGVLVNVNPAYRLHELREALKAADVETLIVGAPFKGSDFVGMVQELCPESAAETSTDWRSAELPALRRLVSLEDRPGPGWLHWSDLERESSEAGSEDSLVLRESAVKPEDVYNIQFTSGTTGNPKGAMLSHRNVLMNAFHTGQRLRYDERDRVCVPVPFYHCFGCVLGTLVCAVHGCAMVVPGPSFDASATLRAVASERCTSLYGVPTMFVAVLADPARPSLDLTSLRTGIMAGSPCPLPLMTEVVDSLGAREVTIGYGQTEASPIITFTSVDDPIEVRVGTVGRPLPGVEVKLLNPLTQEETAPGETGEVCARGHGVMSGYYKNPDATARAIDPEGWLHTGDLARRREDGNYRIVGRSKELIIRGGENIYPPEVEEFLTSHPAVSEAAVVGLPDLRMGEAVAAWVVLRAGAELTADQLREYCRGRIAHFKIPQYLLIVEALPRTVTGKVRKHVLREQGVGAFGLESADTVPTA
ncbi:MAG: AMP-binding protein [Isosphaeraceae bacterium]